MSENRDTAGLSLIKDHLVYDVGGVKKLSSQHVEMLDLSLQSSIWVPVVHMFVSQTFLGFAVLDDYDIYRICFKLLITFFMV
ncbi:uncharacterized protein LOC111029102 [Myzus persicae]|uniref:uncharacterized protein LOC111029102 n=1 Tax=Myzus persicae TaxID=13164 RepID=UPI000B93231B|nr:uncharacterized protein LOC111029102 [Myzus persicae]